MGKPQQSPAAGKNAKKMAAETPSSQEIETVKKSTLGRIMGTIGSALGITKAAAKEPAKADLSAETTPHIVADHLNDLVITMPAHYYGPDTARFPAPAVYEDQPLTPRTIDAKIDHVNDAPTLVTSAPTYQRNADDSVDATITIALDKDCAQPLTISGGWTLSAPIPVDDQFVYTATKNFVADSAEDILVSDALGNSIIVHVKIDNIQNATLLGTDLESLQLTGNPAYKELLRRLNDEHAQGIREAEKARAVGGSGKSLLLAGAMQSWLAGEKNTPIKTTYVDEGGKIRETPLTVSNIDSVPPVLSAPAYSTIAPTNQPVTVAVTCAENLAAPSGWTKSGPAAGVYAYSRSFAANASGTFTLTDAAGNATDAAYAVSNIDTTAPAVSAPAYNWNPDNSVDATIVITLDRFYQQPLTIPAGWTLSAPIELGGKFVYTVTKRYIADSAENVTFTDSLGNGTTVHVSVNNVGSGSSTSTDS